MKKAGPRTWRKLRKQIRKLPCKTCVDHGLLGIDGWQDVTNVNQLGRELYDVTRFKEFKAEVDKAAEAIGITSQISSPGVGRNPINTSLGESPSRPSMAAKGAAVAAYGGNLLAYGIEVGIDSAAATFPTIIPGFGPKSLLNAAATAVFGGLGYYFSVKKHKDMLGTLFFVASGHHATKIVDLVRTGGFPAQFVRPAPFVPVQATVPSQINWGSGGAALF